MPPNDFFLDDVYSTTYSEYHSLLEGIHSARGLFTNTQKQLYLQNLQDSARKLWSEYQRPDISLDYSRHDYQEVYLMRYFFPYSLIVPTLLYHLKNLCHFKDELLWASFFGCGPGSEIYGFMRYLSKTQSDIIKISPAMLDSTSTGWGQYLCSVSNPAFTGWKHSRQIVYNHLLSKVQNSTLYAIADFNSDIEGEGGDFLRPASERWVRKSDLICIQFCLNETSVLRYEQLITNNLIHLVNIMKPGALMLIIERDGYAPVKNLLTNLCFHLSQFNNVQTHRKFNDSLDLKRINNHVPEELRTHLFLASLSKERWQRNNLGRSENGLWLSNSIKFHWLAVSKQ